MSGTLLDSIDSLTKFFWDAEWDDPDDNAATAGPSRISRPDSGGGQTGGERGCRIGALFRRALTPLLAVQNASNAARQATGPVPVQMKTMLEVEDLIVVLVKVVELEGLDEAKGVSTAQSLVVYPLLVILYSLYQARKQMLSPSPALESPLSTSNSFRRYKCTSLQCSIRDYPNSDSSFSLLLVPSSSSATPSTHSQPLCHPVRTMGSSTGMSPTTRSWLEVGIPISKRPAGLGIGTSIIHLLSQADLWCSRKILP